MIPEIGIGNVGIGNVGIGDIYVNTPYINAPYVMQIADQRIWMMEPSTSVPQNPPVVVDIGNPIVDMPGCVEVHGENLEKPSNASEQLVNDDPKGNMTLCDSSAGVLPYYRPMDFDLRKLKIEDVSPPGPPPKEYEHDMKFNNFDGAPVAEPPETDPPTTKEAPPCPGPNAPRIGDVAQNKIEKVSGFELQRDPRNPDGVKICVTLYENIGTVESFLPAPQMVTTTAVIATVATTSALLAKPLADLLLKVVKPVIKKTIAAVQKKLGKTPYKPTQSEVRTNKYREKKGMLGINFAKRAQKK